MAEWGGTPKFSSFISFLLVLSLIAVLATSSVACSSLSSVGLSSPQTSDRITRANGLDIASPDLAVSEGAAIKKLSIAQSISENTTVASRVGETINFDPLKLVNNQWGAPAEETLSSTVFLNSGGSLGWYWDRQNPKLKIGAPCLQPIYPGLRIGGNHREQSNSTYFPIKLSDLKSLHFQVDYDYTSAPTGIYNLSYDFFLLDTSNSSASALRKAEVMVWIHGTLGQPSHTYKGDYTDGHNVYELYSFVMTDGRLYYAFVMKGQPQLQAHHEVDVMRLLANLDLDPDWYIPGVELGNEIVSGSGKIEISKFSANINNSIVER